MSWLNELRGASLLVAARAVDLDRDADGLGDVERAVRPAARYVQQLARVPDMCVRRGKGSGGVFFVFFWDSSRDFD